jgi:hypothetical protein
VTETENKVRHFSTGMLAFSARLDSLMTFHMVILLTRCSTRATSFKRFVDRRLDIFTC